MTSIDDLVTTEGRLTLAGAPEGYDALIVADLARGGGDVLFHVARDDARLAAMAEALRLFAPEVPVLQFPAWDCLPYDRVSPAQEITSRRMATLVALTQREAGKPVIVLTTVNAALQRVPVQEVASEDCWSARVGNTVDLESLTAFLDRNGFTRSGTVMEAGEYAIRGGIVDIFPPGAVQPSRLDLFGDTLDSIRTFDPESQRTTGQASSIDLVPVSEFHLSQEAIHRFRQGYVAAFGAANDGDPLYEAVSAGRRYQGMEHWLPLFHESLTTLFDYAPEAMITLDHLVEESREQRLEQIADYYEARLATKDTTAFAVPAYKPLKPDGLYLTATEWESLLADRRVRAFTPFRAPEDAATRDMGGKKGRSFAPERQQEDTNVFEAVGGHLTALQKQNKTVLVAAWSEGSRDRMGSVLADHGVANTVLVDEWPQAGSLGDRAIGLIVLGLESGFETDTLAVISEQDILGDRLVRARRKRRADNFLSEVSSLTPGDLVVHVDHGIGRFEGLQTIEAAGAPHDCLLILYHGGDKLYLPVENIELLSRYGSEDQDIQLDRLGGTGWQSRKAKLKERIREMAEELIKVAAARELRDAEPAAPPAGLYEEFCARFPYEETEDQARAIEEVIDDLGKTRPMDRLVCGDVGFGKTEVALRSAFAMALSGRQVAVVVPTTLLCRQHFETFAARFKGWPVNIRQLSRLVSAKDAAETKEGLSDGSIDIVVGTHALLSKSIKFKDLGLLIIDEEQHFGVAHKERLKQLKSDVHVLTLTATPIPRTLQLALTGVRELSLIATPPVDRLAVRTFVTPFDPVVIREAILREHYRGGQTFYVCPRISDLAEAQEFLSEQVPEVKVATAHGQMGGGELEDIMNAFYDGKYDVLLSTTIVESGLDVPTANTLIIHRADMFGLAQLYQLRGRVGRSKVRAYAYLTVPVRQKLTPAAEKRLQVLQSLDSLGAGFSLASHDLDIRGAGNLLGEEQSGQIREVGYELYQEMLEEAVASLRRGESAGEEDSQWSPQLNFGTAVLIPENYVEDLQVRLGLYRRLAAIETPDEGEAFMAELIDRFGPLPDEVKHLLEIVTIKRLCREAGVEKVEAGPKGATIAFRRDRFANPAGLVTLINKERGRAKLRPDHRLVFKRDWPEPADRVAGCQDLLQELADIAQEEGAAA